MIRRISLPLLAAACLLAACAENGVGDTSTPDDLLIVTATLPPDETEQPEETEAPPLSEPVIGRVHLGAPPVTIDPGAVIQLDGAASDLVANLFIGLTALDPDTRQVEPALASHWDVSDDGRTWTVYLRDDVYWVQVNPESGEVERVRPVTAGDVVAAVHRTCRADTVAPQASAAFVIAGCRFLHAQDPSLLTPEVIEQTLGARVLNDVVVEFRLGSETAYFPSILAMPMLYPVPAELIESEGDGWTAPETIWTSGAFAVEPSISLAEGATLVANPFWPLPRAGNLDTVQITFDSAAVGPSEAFTAWQEERLDLTIVPDSALPTVPFGDNPSYWLLGQPVTGMVVFSYDTPPFNNQAVREAFSLALDRESIVEDVLLPAGQAALPATAITPPGSAASPAYGTVGLGYDPEAAAEVMSGEGFSSCASVPPTTILTYQSDLALALADRYVAMWEEALGCPEGLFTVEQRPLHELLVMLQEPPVGLEDRRPGLAILTWEADYPDAYHWLADIFGCRELFPNAYLNQARACVDADERLSGAVRLADDETRQARIEAVVEGFFGEGGEIPVIPVFHYARPLAVQPWLAIAPLDAGPLCFDRWTLDTTQRP
jgi:oligopeptide transport system substrate-binding protein